MISNVFKLILKGELITAFDTEGDEGVLGFASEKIAPLLYNDGHKTERIRFADYAKWRKQVDSNINGSGSAIDMQEDDNSIFHEHSAQWRLNKRGVS